MNTGPDLVISPVRTTTRALPKGSLQALYNADRAMFATGIKSGPEISRLERVQPVPREERKFKRRTIALAPPILLQRRVGASDPEDHKCRVSRDPLSDD